MKVGDTVWIFNQSHGGTFVVEGQAKLLKPVMEDVHYWRVEFENGERVERFVDPTGQADPHAHADYLNTLVNNVASSV